MANYKLTISYDGTGFEGWQKNKDKNTIQGKMEAIAQALNGEPTEVNGAGRTDGGVHARGQVANVKIKEAMAAEEVRKYFNRYLPESVKVEKAEAEDERFHARLNAKGKIYSYYIYFGEKPDVFTRKFVYNYGRPLDTERMEKALSYLKGTHDFAVFARKSNEKKSTIRTVFDAKQEIIGECLKITFEGDGFLYNQVRIMTGTLIEIGEGKKEPEIINKMFETQNRKDVGFTAPPQGLFLEDVKY